MSVTSIRFSGLASGLDTESLVNAMVLPYKYKSDAAIQQQKLLELKKDAWKDMNNSLNTFMKNVLDPMRLEGTFNKTATTISNPNLIQVDSNVTIPEGTHSFLISQVASGANVATSTIKYTKDGKESTATNSTALKDVDPNLIGKSIGFKIGDISIDSITLTENMKIEDVEKQVNKQLEAKNITGVNFKFDSTAGGFVVGTKSTGDNQKITLEGDSEAFKILKIGTINNGTLETKYSGDNAKVTYNGLSFESATNEITVNGIKINVLGVSNEPVTITSKKDTTAVFDLVTNFVNEYNKLIEDLNTKIDAPKNKDYMPLTDEQKKEMSESDIKLWESKVETSLFSGDGTLKTIVSDMRKIVEGGYEHNGKKVSFASMGISAKDWKEKGKLTIDEEKLKKAITDNPDQVVSIMNQVGKGLHADFREKLRGSVQKSSTTFNNDKLLDEQIRQQKNEVTKLQDRLAAAEKKYYAQFTAMEKMMSQLNSQSQFLSSQL